jgi:hypothetical protein
VLPFHKYESQAEMLVVAEVALFTDKCKIATLSQPVLFDVVYVKIPVPFISWEFHI